MPLKLLALILPLSLDTFAVSAALGVARLGARERLRLAATFALAEAIMPLLGYAVGAAGSALAGGWADLVAAALLALTGVWMLREGDDEDERAEAAAKLHGWALAGAAFSISVDELAMGVTIGLLRLPVGLVALLIAAQALLASWLGTQLGGRLGEELGDWAERAAGALLLVLAAALVAARLAGIAF